MYNEMLDIIITKNASYFWWLSSWLTRKKATNGDLFRRENKAECKYDSLKRHSRKH